MKNFTQDKTELSRILELVRDIAKGAATEILKHYDLDEEAIIKSDGSPLTRADLASHNYICKKLEALDLPVPLLSEESDYIPYETRSKWKRYWLIDPLDGTKEFIKRNGQFTVNIALIENESPVLGVVNIPVKKTTYYAAKGVGAFSEDEKGKVSPIHVRHVDENEMVLLTSSSHKGKEAEVLGKIWPRLKAVSIGSSIKFCVVAAGEADVYVRNKPTKEWDTGAAQCVLEEAGGRVFDFDGNPLRYNKENILNPSFIVTGDPEFQWPTDWRKCFE